MSKNDDLVWISQDKLSSIVPIVTISTALTANGGGGDYSAALLAKPIIDSFVNLMSVLFLARVVMSWYPKTDVTKFPYNAITWPTEPLLEPARALLPPAFGVDISAIAWVMLLSFTREILTGQQGILTLIERQGGI